MRRLPPILTATCLLGCPYDAGFEPVGTLVPLRASIVGSWVCDLEDEPEWADLTLGWSDDTYLLTLRPRKPPEPGTEEEEEPPWVLYARSRRVGTQEIWTIWSDAVDKPQEKFTFARVEVAEPRLLNLGMLGDGTLFGARLNDAAATEVTTILAAKDTIVEVRVTCRR